MWCEDFMSAYCGKRANGVCEYYDHLSVLIVTARDGQWTRPTTGKRDIVNRLTELRLVGSGWPMETCQRTRTGGLLAVLVAADGARQILIVHRTGGPDRPGGDPERTVVRNQFYLTSDASAAAIAIGDISDGAARHDPSFQRHFGDWVESLDHVMRTRYWTALNVGLAVGREHYAYLAERPGNRKPWYQYDPQARFTSVKKGKGGGRVHIGLQTIQKRYDRLALDYRYRYAKFRVFETCWSVSSSDVPDATAVLAAGIVPEVVRGGGEFRYRQFVQFLVIDTATRKILNDVLCFGTPRYGQTYKRLSSAGNTSSSSSTSSSASTSSPSTSSSTTDSRSPSTYDSRSASDDDRPSAVDLVSLRSRLTSNALKTRCAATTATASLTGPGDQHQHNVTATKLNPRQLFIGCVPLHVKYGQLKLLFEQFGEVTYVKVYDGYNKQTGAKMLHNYAFLFFKDEVSVERAIAASPVPLDSNWNLNVSRPHHHNTTITTNANATGER